HAVFGPGGRGVFFASDEDSEYGRLVYVDLATGKKEIITAELSWDVSKVAISHDRKTLAYAVNEGGKSALYLAATDKPRQATKVALPIGVLGRVAFDRQSARLGVTLVSSTAPADVYVYDLAGKKLVQWTASETGGLPRSRFVEAALVSFPSF